jgi:hypothetical protein
MWTVILGYVSYFLDLPISAKIIPTSSLSSLTTVGDFLSSFKNCLNNNQITGVQKAMEGIKVAWFNFATFGFAFILLNVALNIELNVTIVPSAVVLFVFGFLSWILLFSFFGFSWYQFLYPGLLSASVFAHFIILLLLFGHAWVTTSSMAPSFAARAIASIPLMSLTATALFLPPIIMVIDCCGIPGLFTLQSDINFIVYSTWFCAIYYLQFFFAMLQQFIPLPAYDLRIEFFVGGLSVLALGVIIFAWVSLLIIAAVLAVTFNHGVGSGKDISYSKIINPFANIDVETLSSL